MKKTQSLKLWKKKWGKKKYSDDFGVFVTSTSFIIFILGKIQDPLIKMVRNMKKKINKYKVTKIFIIIEVVNY